MDWLKANEDKVLDLLLSHIWLAILPIVLGFVIAIPIGWFTNRHPRLRGIVLSISSILYTIPSLAMFLVLPSILGTGILSSINVVVALTIYAIAIMARSANDAFESVSDPVLDSATATGFSSRGRALTVELPLAGPVLLAGLRVVSVSTVSLVSVAALLGVDNLGLLFTEGYKTDNDAEIITGIVLIVALALVFDAILVLLGRVLMPWSTKSSRTVRSSWWPKLGLKGGALR